MRHSAERIAQLGTALMTGLLALACGAKSGPSTDLLRLTEECVTLAGPGVKADTIIVGLMEDVDPARVPHPQNDSERLLFRHLYETLIDVDCEGRVYPGLAESWSADAGGRRWTFILREDARFWDGARVTALDVLSSWFTGPEGAVLAPEALQHYHSVAVLSDRVLVVKLTHPHRVPVMFAQPGLAVAKRSPQFAWPLGTRPYRFAASAGTPDDPSPLSLIVTGRGSPGGGEDQGPVILFRLAAGTDARDLFDDGVDLLVANDPSVVDYAATRPDFVSLRLPWDRSYVLISPWRTTRARMAPREPRTLSYGIPVGFREALAQDAVRAEARASESPLWWEDLTGCEVGLPLTPANERPRTDADAPPGTRRVVYMRGDREARELAERMVALAAAAEGMSRPSASLTFVRDELLGGYSRLVAAGLPPEDFAAALQAGSATAYVLALPRRVLAPCSQVQGLVGGAGWLAASSARRSPGLKFEPARVTAPDLNLTHSLVPLVDTRLQAIARPGLSGMRIAWDGTLFLFGANWDER